MYAVVGCSECSALWIVEGRAETSECPRCGHTRDFAKRRKFVETDDREHAREVRASMLANRADEGDAFAELDSVAEMERRLDEARVDDGEYLEAVGVDPETVAEAGERAGRGSGGGGSREEVVRAALRELEEPTGEAVVAYARDRGVPADYVRRALEKLVRAGELVRDGDRYRLV